VSCRSDAFLRREGRLEPKSELTVFKMCALVATKRKSAVSWSFDDGKLLIVL